MSAPGTTETNGNKISRRGALGLGGAALATALLGSRPGPAAAAGRAGFYVIIANPRKARKAYAQLDLAMDTAAGEGAPCDITVFRADGTREDFRVLTNDRGFANTAGHGNLFNVSAGQTALVQAILPTGISGTATLRQSLDGNPAVLAIAGARVNQADLPLAAGTLFNVAVGDLVDGTSLLIANVLAGQPADVKVFVGSDTHAPSFTNPELGVYKVWEVPLTAAAAHSYVIVYSSTPVTVQLAAFENRRLAMTSILAL